MTAAAAVYLRAFRLLWTIKHVDHVLAACWCHLRDTQVAVQQLRKMQREHGIDVGVLDDVSGAALMMPQWWYWDCKIFHPNLPVDT